MEAGEVTFRPIWTGGRKSAFGWALYDWANSPFTTVVTTFIFAAYFAAAIAPDKTTGASQWAFTQGAAAFAIAVLSPSVPRSGLDLRVGLALPADLKRSLELLNDD